MKVEQLVDGLGAVYMGILAVLFVTYLTGCSVHFEVGYHGQTGRDDRIQTQLAPSKNQGSKAGY